MHVEVPCAHILLYDDFVLMGVPSGDHKVTLAANEPIELFKPIRFTSADETALTLILTLFQILDGFLFSYLQNMLAGFLGADLFLIILLSTLVVVGGIGVSVILDFDFHREEIAELVFC